MQSSGTDGDSLWVQQMHGLQEDRIHYHLEWDYTLNRTLAAVFKALCRFTDGTNQPFPAEVVTIFTNWKIEYPMIVTREVSKLYT